MWMTIARGVIAGLIIAAVAEISNRYPRVGGLLLSLPLISIVAFVAAWTKDRDLPAIVRLARETLILVPLGLPFFVPLALSPRWGIGFWTAFALGVALSAAAIGCWFWLGPKAD
ncbi:MAG: hypothetical protein HYS13_21565 [Planctomycetia bacterium]|nr:hypothetical protein [Planctomycetia bacterium]